MIEEDHMIRPKDIRNHYEINHNISIKAVYNLTYTDRYYDPKQWGSVKVMHFPD